MNRNYQINANPLSTEFDFERRKISYGIFQSKVAKLKLDTTSDYSYIILSENELFSVHCNFQYLLLWVKRKQLNQFQIRLIKHLFSTTSHVTLTNPLSLITKIALLNIDIKSFKNYILNNGCFKVFDKQLGSYVEYVECKQVDDNPAIAIGTSKLIFYYKDEVIHEKVLAIY